MELEIEDAYAELGLTPQASEGEVKAAWRRLAARWHPDRNDSPDAVDRMQRLNRALEEIRRARQPVDGADDDGPADPGAGRPGRAGAPGSPRDTDPDAGPEADIDADPDTDPPARTLHHDLELSLEQAAAGGIHELRGVLEEDCPDCEGAGFHEVAGGCPDCGGSGRVRRAAWFGWLSAEADCEACGGDGVGRTPCASCEGTGCAPAHEYLYRVRIPPGVRDGDLLQVDGRDGDRLEIRIGLRPHAFFELDARDGTVRCRIPVDGFAWAANRWVEVPTPVGLRRMRLDREHLVYRLRGQGFPASRGGAPGDCLVTVEPIFPAQLDEAQEALVEQLVATNSGDPGTATGARFQEWSEVLRVWRQGLPERAEPDDGN